MVISSRSYDTEWMAIALGGDGETMTTGSGWGWGTGSGSRTTSGGVLAQFHNNPMIKIDEKGCLICLMTPILSLAQVFLDQ